MGYSNLRVRAWMSTPIVADQYLPLDGVLLYQWCRMDMGVQASTLPGVSWLAALHGEEMRGGRMPIEIVHAKDWYYRASWAQWGPYVDDQDAWSKRLDQSLAYLIDFRTRRGKIDTSAGQYKGYRMSVYYRSTLWVEWYLAVEREWLESMLRMITHLGKKVVQGWGKVRKWEIEEMEEDKSIWNGDKLMRGVPVYHWPREKGLPKMMNYGIRPPYWDKRNQMELVMPYG